MTTHNQEGKERPKKPLAVGDAVSVDCSGMYLGLCSKCAQVTLMVPGGVCSNCRGPESDVIKEDTR